MYILLSRSYTFVEDDGKEMLNQSYFPKRAHRAYHINKNIFKFEFCTCSDHIPGVWMCLEWLNWFVDSSAPPNKSSGWRPFGWSADHLFPLAPALGNGGPFRVVAHTSLSHGASGRAFHRRLHHRTIVNLTKMKMATHLTWSLRQSKIFTTCIVGLAKIFGEKVRNPTVEIG